MEHRAHGAVLISSLYKHASREWKMEGLRNPIKNVSLPSAKTHGDNSRDRRLEGDEESRLMLALKAQGSLLRAAGRTGDRDRYAPGRASRADLG